MARFPEMGFIIFFLTPKKTLALIFRDAMQDYPLVLGELWERKLCFFLGGIWKTL